MTGQGQPPVEHSLSPLALLIEAGRDQGRRRVVVVSRPVPRQRVQKLRAWRETARDKWRSEKRFFLFLWELTTPNNGNFLPGQRSSFVRMSTTNKWRKKNLGTSIWPPPTERTRHGTEAHGPCSPAAWPWCGRALWDASGSSCQAGNAWLGSIQTATGRSSNGRTDLFLSDRPHRTLSVHATKQTPDEDGARLSCT